MLMRRLPVDAGMDSEQQCVVYLVRFNQNVDADLVKSIGTTVAPYCDHWYASFEVGTRSMEPHLHLLCALKDLDNSAMLARVRECLKNHITSLFPWWKASGGGLDCLRYRGNSLKRVNMSVFLQNYFASKVRAGGPNPDLRKTFIWERGDQATLNHVETMRAQPTSQTVEEEMPYQDFGSMTGRARTFKRRIDIMVEHGCATESALRDKLPALYFEIANQGPQIMQRYLQEAKKQIIFDWNLSHFLMPKEPSDYRHVPKNCLTKLIHYHGYDPEFFCVHLFKWADLDLGKRNTFGLFGPPSTGKTMILSAICQCAPVVGPVSRTSETFPFMSCADSSVIVWDECRIKEQHVEDVKALFAGDPTFVEVKMKGAIMVQRTPVLLASNHDPLNVYTANTCSSAHRSALAVRMIVYNFKKRVWYGPDKELGEYPSDTEKQTALKACAEWGYLNRNRWPEDFDNMEPGHLEVDG